MSVLSCEPPWNHMHIVTNVQFTTLIDYDANEDTDGHMVAGDCWK